MIPLTRLSSMMTRSAIAKMLRELVGDDDERDAEVVGQPADQRVERGGR